jgi:hypothetical protein
MKMSEFVSYLLVEQEARNGEYVNSLINQVLFKVGKALKKAAVKEKGKRKELLTASTISEARAPSSTGYPILRNTLKNIHGVIRVRRDDAIRILSDDEYKKTFLFGPPDKKTKNPEVLNVINNIIMTKFTKERFERDLPHARGDLILLLDVLEVVGTLIWISIPDKYRTGEAKRGTKSRRNIIIGRIQEKALVEPMTHVAKEMGFKNFTLEQHPNEVGQFPDAIIKDNETGKILANFDSKGKTAKTTERTHKHIEEKAKTSSGIRKVLEAQTKKKVELSRAEVKDILKIYNVDEDNIYYFLVNRTSPSAEVKKLEIPLDVYDSFYVRKKTGGKTGMAYEVVGRRKDDEGELHRHGLLRIEFRPSSAELPKPPRES